MPTNIILFDGICTLCSKSVQFVLVHDKSRQIYFASLQSEVGQNLLEKFSIPRDIDSIVFIENEEAYIKSEAILRITSYFGGFWNLCKCLFLIPISIRNFIYDFIAKNRYQWFGKEESCWLPTAELKQRFLDN